MLAVLETYLIAGVLALAVGFLFDLRRMGARDFCVCLPYLVRDLRRNPLPPVAVVLTWPWYVWFLMRTVRR